LIGKIVPLAGAEADRAKNRELRLGLLLDPGMGLAIAPEARSNKIVLSIVSIDMDRADDYYSRRGLVVGLIREATEAE
jgi:hypothetical protein